MQQFECHLSMDPLPGIINDTDNNMTRKLDSERNLKAKFQ